MEDPQYWQAAVGPAWVQVDLDAIAENVRLLRGILGVDCRLLAVVKANGYGHGAVAVGATALEAGAAGLGVSTVAEGLALRTAGIRAPILVFTPPRGGELDAALEAGLVLTVASAEGAAALGAAARRTGAAAAAHVKCDTGMGRYGFDPAALAQSLPVLAAEAAAVRWEGIFTHFPRGADGPSTQRALGRFLAMVAQAEAGGVRFELRHAAASAAALRVPESRLDMVRIGTLLYGDGPAGLERPAGLRRAFALRVEAAQIRTLPRGATVGYGSEWRASRPTLAAVLPVGYADGFDVTPAGPYRRLGVLLRAVARTVLRAAGLGGRLGAGLGEITWGGVSVPVLGRVGMQQVEVDCGRVPEAALREPATVHARATLVGAHLARVYVRDGRPAQALTAVGPLGAPALDRES